jgi:hypothetical protein
MEKKTLKKRALASQLCRVRARASSGRRAESLGQSDRERKLHTTSTTALAGKKSREIFSRPFEKTRRGF